MSISITAIIIILLLIPGILFRRAYFIYPFTKRFTVNTTFDEISGILIPTLIFHIGGLWILRNTDYYLDFKNLILVLSAFMPNNQNVDVLALLKAYPVKVDHVCLCFAILWGASYYIGIFLNHNIRKLKIDAKFRFFRYKNEWYYYLTGRVLDFPNVPGDFSKINMTIADILVKGFDNYYIYRGILTDYYLSERGGLSCVCLKLTFRTDFNIDSSKLNFTRIEGDYYLIQAADIVSLNLRYIHQKESIPRFRKNTISKVLSEIILFLFDIISLALPIYYFLKGIIWVISFIVNKMQSVIFYILKFTKKNVKQI